MPTIETKKTILMDEKPNRTLWDSFIACFEKYATFNGRSSRHEFWSFYLGITILSIIITPIDIFLIGFDLLTTILSFAIFIPNLAVTIRRLHDVNKSGWWFLFPWAILLLLIPLFTVKAILEYSAPQLSLEIFSHLTILCVILFFVANIYLIYLFCVRGDRGKNRYGEPPLV
ncbi:MAG: DUF805 domain-containing protein [Alphaproteobacteria bacterium]|nr:DUF805 domain-containing protein [Alphaproteobacteria bacterium]